MTSLFKITAQRITSPSLTSTQIIVHHRRIVAIECSHGIMYGFQQIIFVVTDMDSVYALGSAHIQCGSF